MDQPATFHDLNGASVYITGGGSGVGAALTDGFLAQGAKVAFIGRSDASGFVDEMRHKHGRAPLFMQGDMTDTELLHATMQKAAEAHGPRTCWLTTPPMTNAIRLRKPPPNSGIG